MLVRAVVAVSIFHWQSHITSRLTDHPVQLENTRRVLELMAIGQFLPPQLALVPQVNIINLVIILAATFINLSPGD